MQNSNNSSENRNVQSSGTPSRSSSNSNIPPFVSPRIGDVPMFSRRNRRPRYHPYPLRSIRNPTISRVDSRRKYKINLQLNRRVLELGNDARLTLLSAIADALQIENSPTNTSFRTEDDRMSYNIELRVPNHDDSSLYERDNYNNDYPANNVTRYNVNRNSAELSNALVSNGGNFTSWSGVLNVFQNLFQRNPSSENHE